MTRLCLLAVCVMAVAVGCDFAPSDNTCATDVTTEILTFVASVPDGSTIVFPPGCYRVDGSLRIVNRNNLTFDGQGATFRAYTDGDRDRRHWWVIGGSGITFKNMTVVGANPNAGTGDAAYRADREAQHGFDLEGVQGASIENVTVTDVYGDFVYLGMNGPTPTRDVTVTGSHFERNGRQGITLTGAERVLVEGNTITQVRRASIDIEPNGVLTPIRDLMVRNNTFGPGRLLWFANQGAAAPVQRISFVDNTLTGKAMSASIRGFDTARRGPYTFTGNVSNVLYGQPAGATMEVSYVDGFKAVGNTQPLQSGRNMVLVSFVQSCGIEVHDNVVTGGVGESRSDGYVCGGA